MADSAPSESDEIARQRAALISARLRFAPEVQSLRSAALGKVVESALFVAARKGPMSIAALETYVDKSLGGKVGSLSHADIALALDRLRAAKRVRVHNASPVNTTYDLAPEAADEAAELEKAAQSALDRVVDRIFSNSPGGSSRYRAPFLACICLLFSELADKYVHLLLGDLEAGGFVPEAALARALSGAQARYPTVDASSLANGLTRFLGEQDPDSGTMKWNLAQNYYIAKALGLDKQGWILSEQVFGGATLYLDTNVVIHALEPSASHYRSFKVLSQTCAHLGIGLRVCQATLTELKAVVDRRRSLLERVADEIPDEIAPDVGDFFYQAYWHAKRDNPDTTLDAVFERFERPIDVLAGTHGVEIVDDVWFQQAKDSPETRSLAARVSAAYASRHPDRPKAPPPARHDALMLLWVAKERSAGEEYAWLVTLDTSLPAIKPQGGDVGSRPVAITLDALLQWVSPVAASQGLDDDPSEIFADVLRYQLLPKDKMFDPADFLVLLSMERSCKEMPTEQLRECIQYLRQHGAGLDPFDPADREKLALHAARFLATTAKKYEGEIQRLESEVAKEAAARRQALQEMAELRDQMDILERTRAGETRQLRDDLKAQAETFSDQLNHRDSEIKETNDRWQAHLDADEARGRRRRACKRLALQSLGIVLLFLLGAAICLRFGAGDTLFAKLGGPTTVWTVAGVGAAAVVGFRARRLSGPRSTRQSPHEWAQSGLAQPWGPPPSCTSHATRNPAASRED